MTVRKLEAFTGDTKPIVVSDARPSGPLTMQCVQCGEHFEARRKSAKWCPDGDACKQRGKRRRDDVKVDPVLVKQRARNPLSDEGRTRDLKAQIGAGDDEDAGIGVVYTAGKSGALWQSDRPDKPRSSRCRLANSSGWKRDPWFAPESLPPHGVGSPEDLRSWREWRTGLVGSIWGAQS